MDNCKNLADFYEKFVDKISQFSLQMDEKEAFRTSSEFPSHPYEGSTLEEFKRHSGGLISDFLRQEAETHRLSESDMEQYDTFILPSVQMGPLDIRQVPSGHCLDHTIMSLLMTLCLLSSYVPDIQSDKGRILNNCIEPF